MLFPTLLDERIVPKFREYLLNGAFHHVINDGKPDKANASISFTADEANALIARFLNTRVPVVCIANFEILMYHFAVAVDKHSRVAFVRELLIDERDKGSLSDAVATCCLAVFFIYCKEEVDALEMPIIIYNEPGYEELLYDIDVEKEITVVTKKHSNPVLPVQ